MAYPRRFLFLILLLAVYGGVVRAQQPAPPAPHPNPSPSPSQSQAPPPATQQQVPTIRSTVSLVHLVATATDRRHNFVTDLEKGDFKVLEDGVPQEIKLFGR